MKACVIGRPGPGVTRGSSRVVWVTGRTDPVTIRDSRRAVWATEVAERAGSEGMGDSV